MNAMNAISLGDAREAKLLTIGKVLALLSPEFADMTASKLRFLEEQGLINPYRTASNYRKYSQGDVDRIRIILELQRDKYLPHKVIRQYLEDLDAGRQPTLPGESSVITAHLRHGRGRKYSQIELIADTAITHELLGQAQEAQLLGSEPFEQRDVEIARSLVQLNQRFGIAPRHLRSLKAAADREIGIIEGVIAPVLRKNDTGARSRAANYAQEIESLFSSIRGELLGSFLSKIDQ